MKNYIGKGLELLQGAPRTDHSNCCQHNEQLFGVAREKPQKIITQWLRSQQMILDNNHPDYAVRGQAKGIREVLRERDLWQEHRSNFICSPKDSECDPELNGELCNTLLQCQRDFAE